MKPGKMRPIIYCVRLLLSFLVTVVLGWIIYKDLFFVPRIYPFYIFKNFIKEYALVIAVVSVMMYVTVIVTAGKRIAVCWNRCSMEVLLAILVTVSLVVVYFPFVTGRQYYLYSDAGMDTIEQFYPMYVHLVDRIKDGGIALWNFEWGLGCDLFTRQEWIMDPAAWITILCGVIFGGKVIRYTLLLMQFAKILTSALVCFRYLKLIGFSDKGSCIGGYLYAFSGWIMLWGQHYYFGMAYVYLIILLLMVEKALLAYRKQEHMAKVYLGISIMMALIFLYSVYFGYMIVIFTSVYTIVRMCYLGYEGGRKTAAFFRELGPLIVTVLIGILCAAVMIIPYADIVLNVSTRVQGSFLERISSYVTALYDSSYYMEVLGRLISNNSMGIVGLDQMYYELPQISFSMANILVLPQVFWYGIVKSRQDGISRKEAGLRILSAVLLLLSLVYPLIGSLFNIGSSPVARFTFVLMPFFAVMYAYFIDKCVIQHRINLVLCVAGMIAVYWVIYEGFWSHSINYHYVSSVIIIVNVVLGIVLIGMGKWKSHVCAVLVPVIIIAGACFEGYVTNNVRTALKSDLPVMSDDFHGEKTKKVLDYIKEQDDSFYRVEKNYKDLSVTGDSLLQGYSPVHMYCSTMSRYLTEFYDKIYPTEGEKNINTELGEEAYASTLAITNVKYILTDKPLEWNNVENICENDGIYALNVMFQM